jgi:uncharacterized protein
MSDIPVVTDYMDYANLTQTALRGVIRQALLRANEPNGLPGDHHFFITFLTKAEGVFIPDDLKARYPTEMTIVIQHQYRDLRIDDDRMSVTLSFGGAPKVLRFPYAAITRFYDPSVQFILEFDVEETDSLQDNVSDSIVDSPQAEGDNKDPEASVEPVDNGPKVVSLDQFRKK